MSSARALTTAQLAGSAGTVVLLPVGAYEQHGPHLPLATDAILAEAFAARASALLDGRVPTWVLPTVGFGVSPEHLGFAGTVDLPTAVLAGVCDAVVRAAVAAGASAVVFVNAHGGNRELLALAARQARIDHGIMAATVHAPSLPSSTAARGESVGAVGAVEPAVPDVHAGHYETSVMLAIHPELVLPSLAAADGLDFRGAFVGSDTAAPTPWLTSDWSASGVIGDPTRADAQWGADVFGEQVAALAEAIVAIADAAAARGA